MSPDVNVSATELLPHPDVLKFVHVTRQELLELWNAQQALERYHGLGYGLPSAGVVLFGAVLPVECSSARAGVHMRRLRAIDSAPGRVLVQEDAKVRSFNDILDLRPSSKQWHLAAAEYAERLLAGTARPITVSEVLDVALNLARLKACALSLADKHTRTQTEHQQQKQTQEPQGPPPPAVLQSHQRTALLKALQIQIPPEMAHSWSQQLLQWRWDPAEARRLAAAAAPTHADHGVADPVPAGQRLEEEEDPVAAPRVWGGAGGKGPGGAGHIGSPRPSARLLSPAGPAVYEPMQVEAGRERDPAAGTGAPDAAPDAVAVIEMEGGKPTRGFAPTFSGQQRSAAAP